MTISRAWRFGVVLALLPAVAPVRAADVPLSIEYGRLHAQAPGRANGSIALRATFPTAPPDDVLVATSGFHVVLRDGAALDQTVVWTPADCAPTSRGGFLCLLPEIHWKLRLDPLRGSSSFRATLRMKRLALNGPFAAPLAVRLSGDGAVDRVGETANCVTSSSGALTCRAP